MDMLPVDHTEHLLLGTDEIIVLATGEQTGETILAVDLRMPLRGRTPHTIRNEGDVDATAFVVHSPAAVLAVPQRHGVERLGPIPVSA